MQKAQKNMQFKKKMALKTDSKWWSCAWSNKMLKMSPIVAWQILTWPVKKNNPPLPKIYLWQSLYNKVTFEVNHFYRISDVHFYNNDF